MEAYLYLKSIRDTELRIQEQDRILIKEPLAAILKTLPEEIRDLPATSFFIEKNILKMYDYNAFKLEDNSSLFSGNYDFVYDQKSGYGVINLGGLHSLLMTSIWFIRNHKKLGLKFEQQFLNIKNHSDASNLLTSLPSKGDNYLDSGDGFFLSSMMITRKPQKLNMSDSFRFKQEKHIFKNYIFNFI